MKKQASKDLTPADIDRIKEQRVKRKKFLISASISLIVGLLLTGLIVLVEYYSLGTERFSTYLYLYLVDGFGLSGLLLLLAFLLSYPASEGSFDILAYGIQVFVLTIFRPSYRKSTFPADFYEYKLLKKQQKRKPLLALFYVSLLFIAVGLFMLIPYYQHL